MISQHPILNELFERHQMVFGKDYRAYRNHCYRVFNFTQALMPHEELNEERQDILAVACFFHDAAIWFDGQFDYLDLSNARAQSYLAQQQRLQWSHTIERMILDHHKVRAESLSDHPLIEYFRRADWIDVTLGLRRFGLNRKTIQRAYKVFPDAGFHRRLIELSFKNLFQHPNNPLPMFKW